MTLIGKLIGIEWIKVRRRSVFAVVVVAYTFIISFGLGIQQYMHSRQPGMAGFSLPGGWRSLVDMSASTGMILLVIGIALLTSSESTWRTQRQNVIDGLSRAQYFGAKLLLVVMLSLTLWILLPLIGVVAAAFGGDGALAMPVIDGMGVRVLAFLLLFFIAVGTMGFMFGMLAPSSGAALGFIVVFIMVQPMLAGPLKMQRGFWHRVPDYFPMEMFNNLVSRRYHDAESMARYVAMAQKAGEPAPVSLATSTLVSVVYMMAFVGITWLVFRKRDL